MKKFLTCLLSLVMVLSCISMTAFATEQMEYYDTKGTFSTSFSKNYVEGSITGKTGTYSSHFHLNDGTITVNIKSEYASLYVITKVIPDGVDSISSATSGTIGLDINYQVTGINATSVTISGINGDMTKLTIYYDLAAQDYDLTSQSSLASSGGVTFTVDSQTVTSAKSGDTVTAAAVPVAGYEATLSAKDADDEAVTINADGTFVMPTKAVTVTASYTPYAYLDLEASATYLNSKTIDQNYTLTQSGTTSYTDVTKVKLSWTLPEISASYASTKTWNPDTLTWDETKSTSEIGEKTATFAFTNLSSVSVGAKVSLKKEIGTASDPYTSEVLTLKSKVVNAEGDREQFYTEAPSGTITLKYTPSASDFNSLSAGTGKYGTYTVSLVSAAKVTFDMQGYGTQIDAQYVGLGGKVTEPAAPTAGDCTFDGWYKDAGCTTAWDFAADTVTEAATLYAKWDRAPV